MGNSYGVAVNFFLQILLVPIFIKFWGIDLYADWITITAFTSFFSMSDIGLNTVTMNAYSIAYHKGEADKCEALVANNAILIASIFSITLLVILIISPFISYTRIFNLKEINNVTVAVILSCMILKIGITMYAAVYCSILRAKSCAYIGFIAGNTTRLTEGIILMVGIVIGVPINLLVVLYTVPAFVLLIFYKIYTKRFEFNVKFRSANRRLFKQILIPSISFMTFPLGYAIILQGFTLLVNSKFGSLGVVQYNTTRTLCNFIKVIPNSIKNSIWPEFTNEYAKRSVEKLKKLYRLTIFSSIGIVSLISVGILLLGGVIYKIWTHGDVPFYMPLAIAFVIETILNSTWEASTMTLMATNKHSKFGWTFVILAAINWIVMDLMLDFFNLPLYGVVYGIVVMDIILVCLSIIKSQNLFNSLERHG